MTRPFLKSAFKSASLMALGLALAACGPAKTRIDPDAIAMEERAIEARAFLNEAENQIAAIPSMTHRLIASRKRSLRLPGTGRRITWRTCSRAPAAW